MKPPLGAQIDPAHPFARAHILSLLFNEGIGPLPTVTTMNRQCNRTVTLAGSASANPWTSNREGGAFGFLTTQHLDLTAANLGGVDDFPASAVTITVIRRKRDTTFRQALFSYVTGGAAGSNQIGAHCPFSDGSVYWDFGSNRLSVAGLSFSTTPERWIFTAGPQGSSIWQNGIKVASQATAWTRTASADILHLNYSPAVGDGDNTDFNFFGAVGVQWSDDMCRWWSAEPYDHLYAPPMIYPGTNAALIAALSAASASSRPSLLGLTGVG